jgi:hypothetical protein
VNSRFHGGFAQRLTIELTGSSEDARQILKQA